MIGSDSSAIGALPFVLAVLAVGAIPFCMIGDLGRARAAVFSVVLAAGAIGGGGLVMVETGFWHPGPIAWASAAVAVTIDVYLLRTQGITSGATTSIRSVPALPPLEPVPTPAIWSSKLHSRRDLHRNRFTDRLILVSLIAGWGMVLVADFATAGLVPGRGGSLGQFPIIWFVGIALIAAATILSMWSRSAHVWWAIASLLIALTLTPSILYPLPRLPWVAKHVGVVSYLELHHRVDTSIDIYQNWPAFFASGAWFCDVFRIGDPMSLARWWTPAADLGTLGAFFILARHFLADRFRLAFACTLFVLANTIGQDYFSPQSAAYFLAIALFGIAVWQPTTIRTRHLRIGIGVLTALLIAVTHQITPYMTGLALVVLLLFRISRGLWLPVVTVIPAGIWAALHSAVLRSHVSSGQVGKLSNFAPPGGGPTSGHALNVVLGDVGTFGAVGIVGLLALFSLLTTRDRARTALAVCAAVPIFLPLVNGYGNEAIFRMLLFALPWLAILAASWNVRSGVAQRILVFLIVPAMLAVLTTSYVVASFSTDGAYVNEPGTLTLERLFEDHAPDGSVLVLFGANQAPVLSTARYPDLAFATKSFTSRDTPDEAAVSTIDTTLSGFPRRPAYYLLVTTSAQTYMEQWDGVSPGRWRAMTGAIAAVGVWRQVAANRSATLYRLDLAQVRADIAKERASGP
ncbi:MAG: hypothetical protein ABSF33_04370 [Acidimicrobiales bacterium]|jgi:hypothetical protein